MDDRVVVELHDPRTDRTWSEEMTIAELQSRQRDDPRLKVRGVRPVGNDEAEERRGAMVRGGLFGGLLGWLFGPRDARAGESDFLESSGSSDTSGGSGDSGSSSSDSGSGSGDSDSNG